MKKLTPCKTCNNVRPTLCKDILCVCWLMCDTCGAVSLPALSETKARLNWREKNEKNTKH